MPFEDARDFSRKLKLRTTAEWKKYCKGMFLELPVKPDNIPSQPEQTYSRLGWINYKDWLGVGYRSFEDAKNFVINLGISNVKDWNKYCKGTLPGFDIKPKDIPRDPDLRYRKNWINWEDWLQGSTTRIYGEWQNFHDARKYVRELKIKNTKDWFKYCKNDLAGYDLKPNDIPTSPEVVYKDKGWINYADWLGTTNIRKRSDIEVWMSFSDARNFVHTLNLGSIDDWKKFINNELEIKRPKNMPKSPQFVYKELGWLNWRDWFGKV